MLIYANLCYVNLHKGQPGFSAHDYRIFGSSAICLSAGEPLFQLSIVRWAVGALMDITTETRQCGTCGKYKALDNFAPNRYVKAGLQRTCHSCDAYNKRALRRANPTKYRQRKKELYNALIRPSGETREEYIRWLTTNKYNITVEQFYIMLKQQDYCCAICRQKFDLTNGFLNCHIDHEPHPADIRNKKYGRVRGLLCGSCNNGIGRFRENPEWLRNAADYLEHYSEK